MELKIISPKDGAPLEAIEFNFEELKKEIGQELEKYQGLVYSDDTIKDAKEDSARLRKFAKALSDKRIEVKKLCLKPYDDFETKIKVLDGMVQEPLTAIAGQVTKYEQAKKDAKHIAIKEFWDGYDSPVKALVQFTAVFDHRWLNATVSMKQVEAAITAFFKETETGIETIKALGTEFEDQVMRVYLREFNLSTALAENVKLLEQKAKREEYERQQQAKKAETAAVKSAPETAHVAQPAPAKVVQASTPQPKAEEPRQVDFRVWATATQLADLKAFLNSNNIKFGRVTDQAA
ncbi:MAG: DUF1351 domain-containing protein [Proteobacteria bacterium]|nr:DUF1351 domain-containing protein [Pseudomonadota bacterium]